MAGLTPFPADGRLGMRRPASAGLMDDVSDREVTVLDDVRTEEGHVDRLVRLPEVLCIGARHEGHDRPTPGDGSIAAGLAPSGATATYLNCESRGPGRGTER